MPKITVCLCAGLALIFSGCAGLPVNSGGASQNAAYDAIGAMERGLAGEPLELPSQNRPVEGASAVPNAELAPASDAGQVSLSGSGNSGNRPSWVDAPDTAFPRQRYLSAVGFGTDRLHAERSALTNLTGVFGQSVQAELKTVAVYSEAIMSGVIEISEDKSIQDAVTTSIEMDTLIGAEIADVWFDGRTYYAAAVMEKARAAVLYADLIRSNERIITDLVSMGSSEKNSLNGYSRYVLAASIADANRVYANVLTLVGNTSGINPGAMKNGDDYRLAAVDVARNIPISVNVEGDRAGRIQSAFSRSLSEAGFRSGGNNPRYELSATLTMTDATRPNQQNVFIRYIVDCSLRDRYDNTVLFPFSFNGREGHLNTTEAEEQVLRAAERKIIGEYGIHLRNYLSVLLPK